MIFEHIVLSNTKNKNIYICDGVASYCISYDDKNVDRKDWDVKFEANLYYDARIVTTPFYAQNYATNEIILLEQNAVLYETRHWHYPDDSGLKMMTSVPKSILEEEAYVVSASELELYTIVAKISKKDGEIYFPYSIKYYEKFPFMKAKFNVLFTMDGIEYKYHLHFAQLIKYLDSFLKYQESYVHNNFLDNMLNILNEAKQMVNSNMLDDDKEELLIQTIEIMKKLNDTINDVSPYEYGEIKNVQECITEYNEKNEEVIKQQEEEKKKKEELKRLEGEKNKRDYLERIKYRSELLEHFNTPIIS